MAVWCRQVQPVVGSATLRQIRLGGMRKVAEQAMAPRQSSILPWSLLHSCGSLLHSCVLAPASTPVLASIGYRRQPWVEVNLLNWLRPLFYHLNRKRTRALSNPEPRAPGQTEWHLTAHAWSGSGVPSHEISSPCLPYAPHTVHPASGHKAGWSGTAPKAILILEPPLTLGQTPSSLAFSSARSFASVLPFPKKNDGHVMCGPNFQLRICFLGTQPGTQQPELDGKTVCSTPSSGNFISDPQDTHRLVSGEFSYADPFTFSCCVAEELYSPLSV